MDTNSHECFRSPHSNSDGYIYPDANCYCYTYRYSNPSYAHTDSETYTRSAASADAGTAPVSLLYQKERHCSIWLNCLDNLDALRVKGVYTPKRKQGESEH
jgi:hypothetical protein